MAAIRSLRRPVKVAGGAREQRRRWPLTVISSIVVAVYMFPLYWMISTSVKAPSQLFTEPPTWIPTEFEFSNYVRAVLENDVMLRSLSNSGVISVGATILTLTLSAPAAYALARLRLRWTGVLLLPFLVAQLLPTINIALPIFVLFSQLGLVNSLLGLVLANTVNNLPFAVIILRPFFLSVPRELEEAASIDGAGRMRVFLRIVIPLVKPGLATVGILSFVMSWGEFIFGLTLTTQREHQPVTVALNGFIGQYGTQWGPLMAASTVVAIPIVVVFMLLGRYIKGSLIAGAVKD